MHSTSIVVQNTDKNVQQTPWYWLDWAQIWGIIGPWGEIIAVVHFQDLYAV